MHCSFLPSEAISIVNFHKVPNSDVADTNNISFAFEVTPPIQYGGPLTYDIDLHWEEELREYSGSISSYYYRSRNYYSRTCREYGNLRRNGQTYQFSVSKATLGSGPLYVSVSASLFCNESNSRYYYRYCLSSCSSWQFKGQSDFLRVDTIHGMEHCDIVIYHGIGHLYRLMEFNLLGDLKVQSSFIQCHGYSARMC